MSSTNAAAATAHTSGLLTARPERRPAPQGGEPESVGGVVSLGLEARRDGLLYAPESPRLAAPLPLVLLLHGAGGDGAAAMPILEPLARRHGCLLLAPDSRGRTWDVILGGYGPDVGFIDRALDRVFDAYPVDAGRVAVAGFSDGASYALGLGLSNGELFRDVLAFSPGFMAPTRLGDRPRCFVAHGTADPVLPIEATSRRLVPALRRAGLPVEYHEFDGGHLVPPELAARAIDRFLEP